MRRSSAGGSVWARRTAEAIRGAADIRVETAHATIDISACERRHSVQTALQHDFLDGKKPE